MTQPDPYDPDPLHAPAPVAPPDPTHAATPLCPHFGPCGGCQLQHLAYPAQLQRKRDHLAHLLADLPSPAIQTHAADPWHYRNRIRLRLEPAPDGTFQVGYNHHASNRFLPIGTCPIAAPLLVRAALTLAALPSTHPAATPWLAATAEIELFCTPDESRLQLTFHLRSTPNLPAQQQPRSFTALCDALHHVLPELAGAGALLLRAHHTNAARNRPSSRRSSVFAPATWGAPGLAYPVPLAPGATPIPLWVSRASFFQINRHLLSTLVHLATAGSPATAPPTGLAWDLFAGVGLFTRALAAHFARLAAVETSPAATADLAAARLPHLAIHPTTTLSFLQHALLDRDRPSLVLLDPPRAGLGPEATTLLTRLAPTRITYVSCDPTSLSRDLRPMLSSGYNLAELHLVDLFPQTVHQETVAVLTREPAAPTA